MQENVKNEAELKDFGNTNEFSNEIKPEIEDKKYDLSGNSDKNGETSSCFNENLHKFAEINSKESKIEENSTENMQNSAIFDDKYFEELYELNTESNPVSNFSDEISHKNSSENSFFQVTNEEKRVFLQLFPGVSIEKAQIDPNFKLFAKDKGTNGSFSSIYKDYVDLVKKISNDIKSRQIIAKNNKSASPGALSSSNGNFSNYFTREQVLKMSKEQIAKNYKIIRESQQKW